MIAGNKNKHLIIILLVLVAFISFSTINAKSVFGGRVPGTKWCGPGNDAVNDTDFGERERLDRCCYNHDRCEIRALKQGLSRFGFNNTGSYTKSHCICDKKFRDCLRESEDGWASFVGKTYFRVTKKCFMEYYPILKCKNKKTYKK